MSEISKGMLALRKSRSKAERIEVGGDMFYFRRLTIELEDSLEEIIKRHQDPSLKAPPPLSKEDEADPEKVRAWTEQFGAVKRATEKLFRRLTAELMKFLLLDETDKPLFSEEDTVDAIFDGLDNVYAGKFFQAYMELRQGAQTKAAGAGDRFRG